jgi:hypothetical protein
MSYNIDAINTMSKAVDYSETAEAEYEAGNDDVESEYTARFEREFVKQLGQTTSDDIGGLVVYLRGKKEVAVYDYENFCGWVL